MAKEEQLVIDDPQLQKLVRMLKLWLRKNEIDGDTHFYTIAQWGDRKELYLNDAELVITTEGGLNFQLNYGDPDEFDDLVNSFGFYYEMGHSWNLGFYRIEEDRIQPIAKTYTEKLRDPRWLDKREKVLQKAGKSYQDCGNKSNLQVHHCYYLFDFEPWEYPLDALRALCPGCHEKRDTAERILRGNLAELKREHLEALSEFTTSGRYWYPEKELFEFIANINADQEQMKIKFIELLMLKNKNH